MVDTLSGKGRIVFPIDVYDTSEAVRFATLLKDDVGVFKIGLELFTACGPSVVEEVKGAAPLSKIFLDLKLHDIPATVAGAVGAVRALGVDFLTVHTAGGRAMLEAACSEASGPSGSSEPGGGSSSSSSLGSSLMILGVTALTSLSSNDLADIGICSSLQNPEKLVLERARLASTAGLGGIVCSGEEVAGVKELFPDLTTVVPGIRLADYKAGSDDQRRVVTPGEAVRRGADYIVVGRPIREAEDPVAVAREIASEI